MRGKWECNAGSPTGFLIGHPKLQFNGADGGEDLDRLQLRENALVKTRWSFVMSKTAAKIAFALLLTVATSATSFAQAARTAGAAGSGNLAISGTPPGPANAGGMNNVMVDPSGIGNASRVAPLPQPSITVPAIPVFK
jgi:hypothetical protein